MQLTLTHSRSPVYEPLRLGAPAATSTQATQVRSRRASKLTNAGALTVCVLIQAACVGALSGEQSDGEAISSREQQHAACAPGVSDEIHNRRTGLRHPAAS